MNITDFLLKLSFMFISVKLHIKTQVNSVYTERLWLFSDDMEI